MITHRKSLRNRPGKRLWRLTVLASVVGWALLGPPAIGAPPTQPDSGAEQSNLFSVTRISPQQVVVIKGGYDPGFTITLPDAADWQLTRKLPEWLFWGDSKSLNLIASLTVRSGVDAPHSVAYLQGLLKNISAKFKVQDSRLVTTGDTPVLIYRISQEKGGKTQIQTNYWAVRSGPAGELFRLHISTMNTAPDFLARMGQLLPKLMDRGFKITAP